MTARDKLKDALTDLDALTRQADGIQTQIQQTADVITAATTETDRLAADVKAQERQGVITGEHADTTPLQVKIDAARRRAEAAHDLTAELVAQTPTAELERGQKVLRSASAAVIIEETEELLQRYSAAMRVALTMQWKIDAAVWSLREHREDLALSDKEAPDDLLAEARRATFVHEVEAWRVEPFRGVWRALFDNLQTDAHARPPVD